MPEDTLFAGLGVINQRLRHLEQSDYFLKHSVYFKRLLRVALCVQSLLNTVLSDTVDLSC